MITSPPPSTTTHHVHGDHGLFADCPDCNSRDFLINDTEPVAFTCLACGGQWHYSLGYVWRLKSDQPKPSSRS